MTLELTILLWFAGLSVTGFLFLALWCRSLKDEIDSRVTNVALNEKLLALLEIRNALLGTMDQEGLISKVRRMDEACALRHPGEKK